MTQIATAFDGVGYVISGDAKNFYAFRDGSDFKGDSSSFNGVRTRAQQDTDARACKLAFNVDSKLKWETIP